MSRDEEVVDMTQHAKDTARELLELLTELRQAVDQHLDSLEGGEVSA
jgi:hypothetical protein